MQTTDTNGHPVVVGDFVRYHGSKVTKAPVTLLRVRDISTDGLMYLRHEGDYPFSLTNVRPCSVTFDC